MEGIAEVLVAGSRTAQADFRHYVGKHRPEVAQHIVGWETVGHMSDGEIVALARRYFSCGNGNAHEGGMSQAPDSGSFFTRGEGGAEAPLRSRGPSPAPVRQMRIAAPA